MPTDWVDFREVRERVSLETVLFTLYELHHLKRRGNKVIGSCPVHGGDSPRAFHAELDKNVWHCFTGCREGGNQLDFVAHKEGISIREAALKLKAAFMDGGGSPPTRTLSPSKSTGPKAQQADAANDDHEAIAQNPPLSMELRLKAEHSHLTKDRGLRPETIAHFGVGYCSRGIMRGCIAIPIHNPEGQRVAYAGRRLKASEAKLKGKYAFPKGFRKDLELYNFHRASTAMHTDGLILVEGFFSVMKLYEAGFENVVAVMGCSLSEQQAQLAAPASDVVILFDGNEAGRAGAETAATRLASDTIVRVAMLPDGYEPEDLDVRALRWLVRGLRILDMSRVSLTPRQ